MSNLTQFTAERQNAVSAFVDQHVFVCLSGIAHELASHDDELRTELYHHAIPFQHDHDGECANCEAEDVELNDDDVCEQCFIDNDEDYTEIFEHWAVSTWLYNRLEEKDELVVDLFGTKTWGRATTGQAILLDQVINDIYDELQERIS